MENKLSTFKKSNVLLKATAVSTAGGTAIGGLISGPMGALAGFGVGSILPLGIEFLSDFLEEDGAEKELSRN